MTRILPIAATAIFAFGLFAVPVAHAKKNPLCTEATQLIKATVRARQDGTSKETLIKLTSAMDAEAAERTKAIIEQVFSNDLFKSVPPQTAGAYFSATCK
jgi:hypothetical protein